MALPTSSWPSRRTLSFSEIAANAIEAERLGFHSVWAMDHFFLDHDGVRTPSPDPMVLLAYVAGRTRRITLGSLVLCAAFRSPGQVVREAKALMELSGGRFILGLGAGWFEAEYRMLGLAYSFRVSRLEEYVRAVSRLMEDEDVDFLGEYFALRGAAVPGGVRAPIWLAGAGARVIGIAARYADGWSPNGNPEAFSERLALLRREEASAHRAPGSVRFAAPARILIASASEAAQLRAQAPYLGDPTTPGGAVAIGGPEAARDLVLQYGQLGCDEVILHFSPEQWSLFDRSQPAQVAAALGLCELS